MITRDLEDFVLVQDSSFVVTWFKLHTFCNYELNYINLMLNCIVKLQCKFGNSFVTNV